MKKILGLLLAICLAFSFVGCGGTGDNGGKENDPSKKTISICVTNFGYGYSWLEKVSRAYENQHKDVKINITTTVLPYSILGQIEGGLTKFDIFFGTAQLYGYVENGYFLNLDNVFNAIPDGESKTVKEKLGVKAADYLYLDHYCAFPYVESNCALLVNYTTLDTLLGKGNYELPRTTNEMFALSNRVRSAGGYAFGTSLSDNYFSYMLSTLWAQYDYDGYKNYWYGTTGTEGDRTLCAHGESLEQPGKLAALKIIEQIMKKTNGYVIKEAAQMTFAEASLQFCGQGYGFLDNKLVAFTPNGAWFENEARDFLEENPQDIGFEFFPVISTIINMVPDRSIENDAELSALIKAIDAGSASLVGTGYEVTQADYDYVKRARFLSESNTAAHQCGIVATTENVSICEDFLTFLASDVAAKIISKELTGLTTPFYSTLNDDAIQKSDFVRRVLEYGEKAETLIHAGNQKMFMHGLSLIRDDKGWIPYLFQGTSTADKISQDDYNFYMSRWDYLSAE